MTVSAHIPVLLEEVASFLVSEKTEIFVDATVGGAGHSAFILEKYKNLKIIGLDADEKALEIAGKNLAAFKDRATLVRGNFKDLKEILKEREITSINGILFDLGLSTYQIFGERGFSFNDDAFLDMRMDNRQPLTAYDVVNGYNYDDLKAVVEEYGEEYRARMIAKAIVDERKKRPITTAKELSSVIMKAKRRTGKIHPATKTFQAIRVEVNGELKNLSAGIEGAIDMLAPHGRIGVISFHSLEDRMVKNVFKNNQLLNIITKKPFKAGRSEVLDNPNSRSAKLRVAEKK